MKLQTRRWLASLAAVTLAMAALLLAHFPPAASRFYPQCPVYLWLHLLCPGCGGTRALAALLHGKLLEAVHFNAAIIFLLPPTLGFFSVAYGRAVRPGPFIWPTVPDAWLKLTLCAMVIFTVFRNIPIS